MDKMQKLAAMRAAAGRPVTKGLADSVINEFLAVDPRLGAAIDEAETQRSQITREYPDLMKLDEAAMIERVQEGFVNFYPQDQTNPYVALAARGPWIVTAFGAVLHDSGGYGMIGFGHAPEAILEAMSGHQVMANIMTPNISQLRLVDRLNKEIGQTRKGTFAKPFTKYICMNSGSESVTVALRITDINAAQLTNPGGKHAGKRIMFLTLKGGFHGRTERPAQASNSSHKKYVEQLATFRGPEINHTIPPNDVDALKQAFAWAEKENVFFEAMLMEPVMGEGDPGKAISPEFYRTARELTRKTGTLLVVDSIQAGIRAHGYLSITDYPGFRELEAPDMETYSKAVNAGQYPLSVLALTASAAKLYVRGVYGNTKTTNPRALDVACAVLDRLTPALRSNIVDRGAEFLQKFEELKKEFPDTVTKVQGTGLLVSIEIDPKSFKILGKGELEEWLRREGIGVIHGGANSLRFTPHFEITSKEVNLICGSLRRAFKEGPRLK